MFLVKDQYSTLYPVLRTARSREALKNLSTDDFQFSVWRLNLFGKMSTFYAWDTMLAVRSEILGVCCNWRTGCPPHWSHPATMSASLVTSTNRLHTVFTVFQTQTATALNILTVPENFKNLKAHWLNLQSQFLLNDK